MRRVGNNHFGTTSHWDDDGTWRTRYAYREKSGSQKPPHPELRACHGKSSQVHIDACCLRPLAIRGQICRKAYSPESFRATKGRANRPVSPRPAKDSDES